ncbi:MAG TPA: cyclase family protein [Thermoanaerobaculia bacterium]|nr:cyclase family protein [Thermoanaerobaculia bacterium]
MSEVLQQLIEELASGRVRVIDLTQPLGPETPVIGLPPQFAASPGLTIEVLSRYDEKGPAWYWNTLRLGEHTGTHFDAPIHWVTGKELPDNACDTIPARRFVGPACVIDVTAEVEANPDFLLTRERIMVWEAKHGRIPAGAWVLLRTGWSRRRDPREFLNVAADGPHSPGFHRSASELLAHERNVLGVGVETVGTDAGQAAGFDPPFPSHTIMHGSGRFGLASLRNLEELPPTGALVIAAPLKIVGGSGSPLRVLALAPGPDSTHQG